MTTTALVTGASSGFGAAIARRFAADGWNVIVAGRRVDRLDALAADLGDGAHAVELDVTDHEAITAVLGALPARFADIDVLVNNAGLALGVVPAQEADLAKWDTMIATNVTGLVHLTHAVLPGMIGRGRGHVVNIGSIAGTYPYPGGNVYGATKAFVHQFSLNLRADLVGTPVRVTNIEPGMCGGTEFSLVRLDGDRQAADAVYEGVEYLTADDIAEAVHWVANLPAHVNVNVLEVTPVAQASGPLRIAR